MRVLHSFRRLLVGAALVPALLWSGAVPVASAHAGDPPTRRDAAGEYFSVAQPLISQFAQIDKERADMAQLCVQGSAGPLEAAAKYDRLAVRGRAILAVWEELTAPPPLQQLDHLLGKAFKKQVAALEYLAKAERTGNATDFERALVLLDEMNMYSGLAAAEMSEFIGQMAAGTSEVQAPLEMRTV